MVWGLFMLLCYKEKVGYMNKGIFCLLYILFPNTVDELNISSSANTFNRTDLTHKTSVSLDFSVFFSHRSDWTFLLKFVLSNDISWLEFPFLWHQKNCIQYLNTMWWQIKIDGRFSPPHKCGSPFHRISAVERQVVFRVSPFLDFWL